MIDRYRLVPAAYVFLRRQRTGEDEVLLQLRQGTGYRDGYWAAAAAGHVEAGESAVQAACREAGEELGIRVDPADLIPLASMHRTGGNGDPIDERVDFFFACQRWDGEPRLVELHKAAALSWFALDALPHPVVPHELIVLAALRGSGTPPPILAHGFDS